MIFVEGLILGLSNNLYCAAACAPAVLPSVLAKKATPVSPLLKYLTGRFLAYMFFGAVSGIAGIYFNGRINPRIFAILVIFFSVVMLISSFSGYKARFCPHALQEFTSSNAPFLAGFVMGINICPPFLLALSETTAFGNITMPIIFFSGFFLGSSAWLIPLFFLKFLPDSALIKASGRILAAAVGTWFFVQGIKMLG